MTKQHKGKEKIANKIKRKVAVVFNIPHLGGECSTMAVDFILRKGVKFSPIRVEIYEDELLTKVYAVTEKIL